MASKKLLIIFSVALIFVVSYFFVFKSETVNADLTTGLVGYWTLNESSGSLLDSSVNNNNGTNNGALCGVAGKISNACQFNGVAGPDNNISISDPGSNSILDFGKDDYITISVWAKPYAFDSPSSYNTLFGKGGNYGLQTYRVTDTTAKLAFYFRDSASPKYVEYRTTETIALNSWLHIIVVYKFGDGASIGIYVDGEKKGGSWVVPTGNESPLQNDSSITIGNLGNEEWNGIIDEFRIYDRILTDPEISDLFNAASPPSVGVGVDGWLWGGTESVDDSIINGNETSVGWISLNSTNCDIDGDGIMDRVNVGVGTGDATASMSCSADGATIGSYYVAVPSNDGNVSGYGWSENLGWIDFGNNCTTGTPGAGKYKANSCAPPSGSAGVARIGNNLVGWARVVSIAEASVSNPGYDSRGWIHMSDLNYSVSVNPGASQLSGYAWSDEFGYIDFSRTGLPGTPQLVICPSGLTMTKNSSANLYVRYWLSYVGTADCISTGYQDVTTDSSWSSADSSIASVSLGSVMSYNIAGSTQIAASYSGLSDAIDATVIGTCNYNLCDQTTGFACSAKTIINGICPLSNCSDTTTPETCRTKKGVNWIEITP